MRRVLCAVLSFFALAVGVRADEIRLKDGSKIVGNVVGYEDGSFKVETPYGFAMVRKDSISEIIPAAPSQTKQPSAGPKTAHGKPAESVAPTATPKPLVASESDSQPTPLKSAVYVGARTQSASDASSSQQPTSLQPIEQHPASQQAISSQPGQRSAAMLATPAPAHPAIAETNAAPASSASTLGAAPAAPPNEAAIAPTAAALPSAPPEPLPVREMVRGNLYINQTYGFEMYRAPDWEPIVAARAALPNAIAALGTSDQSTLLIIGRDRAHDTLEAQSAATEKAVEEVYENYRPMPPERTTVAGSPAVERRFRGEADQRDWSVVLVTLERNGDVFTILAMTDANSELVQIQENVIAKAVASLQFTAPPS